MQETQETQVQSLGQDDRLEEEMATCSSILAWRIPWTEDLGGLQSMGSQRVRHDLATKQQQQDISVAPGLLSPFVLSSQETMTAWVLYLGKANKLCLAQLFASYWNLLIILEKESSP